MLPLTPFPCSLGLLRLVQSSFVYKFEYQCEAEYVGEQTKALKHGLNNKSLPVLAEVLQTAAHA